MSLIRRMVSRPSLRRPWVWKKAERASLARFVNAECAVEAVTLSSDVDGESVTDRLGQREHALVAEWIYDRMREIGVRYDREGYLPEGEHSQRVRTPREIVRRKRATCLDLSLLYAGLALDVGLRPVVVVLDGHAFVGVVTVVGYELYIAPGTTGSELAAWIDNGQLVAIESTGVARGTGLNFEFERARAEARLKLDHHGFQFVIDPEALQRQSDLQPEPCDRVDARKVAAAAVSALVLIAAAAGYYRVSRVPVFDRDVDGVAVAPVEDGDDEIGQWLMRALENPSGSSTHLVDISHCPRSAATFEVWGPDDTAKADLTDATNPSNIDVLIRSRVVNPTDGGDMIQLTLVPHDVDLRRAADPVFLAGLPTVPADIGDRSESALISLPELGVLPAVVAGLRALDGGDAASLEAAQCLFTAAEDGLADQTNVEARRTTRFLASIDLLRANIAIQQASNRSTAEEEQLLDQAGADLDRARDRLDESGAADAEGVAIVDANWAGIIFMSLVDDDGRLTPDTSMEALDGHLVDLERRAVAASASPRAVVAVNAIAAMLAVVGAQEARAAGDTSQTEELLARSERYVEQATAVGEQYRRDPSLSVHLADAYHARALAAVLADEFTDGVTAFEQAAALVDGGREHHHLLGAALIYRAACDVRWRKIVDEARLYFDQSGDQRLQRRIDSVLELDVDCQ